VNEFVENLQDVFRLFGPIEVKSMFGGHGIFHQGLMFGIVSDDILYLKADAENASAFKDLGLPQFEYLRKGKVARLSYCQVPEEVMDDRAEAAKWAGRSFEAALRGKAKTSWLADC
jgi:DNA transformation protein and related proteins